MGKRLHIKIERERRERKGGKEITYKDREGEEGEREKGWERDYI